MRCGSEASSKIETRSSPHSEYSPRVRVWVLLLLSFSTFPTSAFAEPVDVLERHGCLGCHSVDGSSGAGPTLAGIAQRRDDAHLRRALTDPGADVAEGFVAMPDLGLDPESVDALVDAMHALPEVEPPFEALWPLVLCCVLFVGLHFFLSGPVRAPLVSRLGFGRFTALYSVLIGLPFAGLFWGWSVAPHVVVWTPPIFTIHLAVTLNLLAAILIVAGYTTASPTVAGTNVQLDAPQGVLTITRHPALWGFGLWALAHLGANGDAASIVLFGGFVVLSFGGMLHIDRRRRASDPSWAPFEFKTSIVPFAAVLAKRTKLDLRGLWWRAIVGIVVYATIVVWSHEWLTGVSPLPIEMRRALGS